MKTKFPRMFGVVAAVVLLAMFLVPSAVFAADPTVVNVNWSGTTVDLNSTVTAGNDAVHSCSVNALGSAGAFNVRDENDNPYTYNVDSTSSNANLWVSGGFATYTVQRTDSKTSSYGLAGQNTYSFIGVNSDGTAAMGMCTYTNYASAGEANYGKPEGWTPNNAQFTATSPTGFRIIHQVTDSDGDTAWLDNTGTGTAKITSMSSNLGAGSLKFGAGAGCYTRADFTGTGVQNLTFYSAGHSSVTQFGLTVPGDGSANSATLTTIINFSGTFSTPNPSTSASNCGSGPGSGFSANVD